MKQSLTREELDQAEAELAAEGVPFVTTEAYATKLRDRAYAKRADFRRRGEAFLTALTALCFEHRVTLRAWDCEPLELEDECPQGEFVLDPDPRNTFRWSSLK